MLFEEFCSSTVKVSLLLGLYPDEWLLSVDKNLRNKPGAVL